MSKENKAAPEAEEKPRRPRPAGVWIRVAIAVVSIAIGALLLFVPAITTRIIAMSFSILLIVAGGAFITYFFTSGAFRRVRDNTFSIGVLLAILGICGLVKLDDLVTVFPFCIGLVTLLLGILMLQETVQLTVLGTKANIAEFVLTVLTVLAGIVVITDFRLILDSAPIFPELSLFIAGILTLVCLLISVIAIRAVRRRKEAEEKKAAEEAARAQEEAALAAAAAAAAASAAPAPAAASGTAAFDPAPTPAVLPSEPASVPSSGTVPSDAPIAAVGNPAALPPASREETAAVPEN